MERLEQTLQQLTERVQTTEKQLIGATAEDGANMTTIVSLLTEIAVRLGCTEQRFQHCYAQRQAYWHQHYLEQIESDMPALAAELDTRSSFDGPSDGQFEPLFDGPA